MVEGIKLLSNKKGARFWLPFYSSISNNFHLDSQHSDQVYFFLLSHLDTA
jgi:hypothetical protein